VSPAEPKPRWLLLVHQLPTEPSKLRVKAWRRLQAVGAVAVKNSVYVLPESAEAREDFEWIRGEIVAQGGEALVFAADAVDDLAASEVKEVFVAARRGDWGEVRERAASLAEHHGRVASGEPTAGVPLASEELEREIKALRARLAQIDRIDYFHAPGRDDARAAVETLERLLEPEPRGSSTGPPRLATADFRGKRWLTRPRPGVDRMATAWLIRRFIDPEAPFLFAERILKDEDVVPFDMYGVRLGHQGEHCTFETMLDLFGLAEPALERIGRLVHDLDLAAGTLADAETSTVGRLIQGLRAAFADDAELLEHGIVLFEALYQSLRSEASAAFLKLSAP